MTPSSSGGSPPLADGGDGDVHLVGAPQRGEVGPFSLTPWNACSLSGGVGASMLQFAARRRKLMRMGRYFRKSDITVAQEVRGGEGAETELWYSCWQAQILATFVPRADTGGLVVVARQEFCARFESVTLDVIVPSRIAILRCRGSSFGLMLWSYTWYRFREGFPRWPRFDHFASTSLTEASLGP